MKRDFSKPLIKHDGRPLVRAINSYTEDGQPKLDDKGVHAVSHYEPMTLRFFALDAVGGRWKGDEGMTVAQARARMALYDKLAFGAKDGIVDLDAEEPKMILDCMLRQGRDPIAIGRMAVLLDKDQDEASK